jgi:hypothetical protein
MFDNNPNAVFKLINPYESSDISSAYIHDGHVQGNALK